MKIGDVVVSKKTRPDERAKVIKVDISLDKKKKPKTKYVAEYADKSTLIFYGWDVNKTVTKVEENDGQLCLFDFLEA